MKNKIITYLSLLLLTFVAYKASLQYGFSQDDFYHLVLAKIASIKDLLNFFLPSSSWVFYRPLSTQLYYFVFSSLFGENAPLFMHIFMLFLHAANAYLVTKIVAKFRLTPTTSLLIGALYAVSNIHFLSLFYIGATQQLLSTFFCLLALYAFLHNRDFLVPFWFAAALLSKEIVVRFIPMYFLLVLLRTKSLPKTLKTIVWPSLILLVYLISRYLFGFGSASEYNLVLRLDTTLATIMWYLLMTFGLPENILSYGLSGGQIAWGDYLHSLGLLTATNFIFATLSILLAAYVFFRKILAKEFILVIYTIGIWLIGLLPIIFLPTHRYAHYLDLGLVAILYLVLSYKSATIRVFFVIFFIIASLTGIAIDEKTHWNTSRAKLAKYLISRIKSENACQYQKWYLNADPDTIKQVEYAIMYDNGPKIICNNKDIKLTNHQTDADFNFVISSSEIKQK